MREPGPAPAEVGLELLNEGGFGTAVDAMSAELSLLGRAVERLGVGRGRAATEVRAGPAIPSKATSALAIVEPPRAETPKTEPSMAAARGETVRERVAMLRVVTERAHSAGQVEIRSTSGVPLPATSRAPSESRGGLIPASPVAPSEVRSPAPAAIRWPADFAPVTAHSPVRVAEAALSGVRTDAASAPAVAGVSAAPVVSPDIPRVATGSGLVPATVDRAEQGDGDQGDRRGPVGGDVFFDGERVGHWMARELGREAGRPSAGGTAFDPSMGPLWPGALQGN